jgi:mannosyltransferase OCH1-like enzyme
MYVDFDHESLEPMDSLLEDRECCFAVEAQSEFKVLDREVIFNNALMACTPAHPFMKKIITEVFLESNLVHKDLPKSTYILKTTGPWKLMEIYDRLSTKEKESIYLIPAKYVSPFDMIQARRVRMGEESEELEQCLAEAYAVHYFFGAWMTRDK